MTDPETVKALGQLTETIGKAYDDLAHPAALELGKLFSLPLKVANHYGQRLVDMMTTAKDAVPAERQLPASSSIAGPIFENVKYLEDGSPLLTMYQKLLTQLIDRDGVSNAHPAFPRLIEQLSPDEAFILYRIKQGDVPRVRHMSYPEPGNYVMTHEDDQSLLAALMYPQHKDAYFSRLLLLGLIMERAVVGSPIPGGKATGGAIQNLAVYLTAFGEIFAKACIPNEWDFPKVQADDGTG